MITMATIQVGPYSAHLAPDASSGTFGQVFHSENDSKTIIQLHTHVKTQPVNDISKQIKALKPHENVVEICDVDEAHGHTWLILEGHYENLSTFLAPPNDLSWEQKLMIMKSCVDGLNALHAQEIVHGGLNPEKILILRSSDDAMIAKVALPYARLFCIKSDDKKNSPKMKDNIAKYASPEGDIGIPTDIFSLGVLFYEVYSHGVEGKKELPHQSLGLAMLMAKERNEEMPKLSRYVAESHILHTPNADQLFGTLLDGMTYHDAQNRISLQQVKEKLEEIITVCNDTADFKFKEYIAHRKNVLGEGSFGTIYRASDQDGALIAAKCITIAKPREANGLSLAENIMNIQNTLKIHPHIVSVLGTDYKYGRDWIFMEYINYNLPTYLEKFKPYLKAKMKIMMDCCEAIEFMHDKEIVHRNLKQENVLIAVEGQGIVAKITDTSLSTCLKDIETSKGSTCGSKINTGRKYFLPPKVGEFDDREIPYDMPMDIYSLGILYLVIYASGMESIYDWKRMALNKRKLPNEDICQLDEDTTNASVGHHVKALINSMTNSKRENRPTASDVKQKLSGITLVPDEFCAVNGFQVEIDEFIRECAFGDVYSGKVEIAEENKVVNAIKLKGRLSNDVIKFFNNLKRQSHQYLVNVFDVYSSRESQWLITERYNTDLKMFLKNESPDSKLKIKLMTDCAMGISYLHDQSNALLNSNLELTTIFVVPVNGTPTAKVGYCGFYLLGDATPCDTEEGSSRGSDISSFLQLIEEVMGEPKDLLLAEKIQQMKDKEREMDSEGSEMEHIISLLKSLEKPNLVTPKTRMLSELDMEQIEMNLYKNEDISPYIQEVYWNKARTRVYISVDQGTEKHIMKVLNAKHVFSRHSHIIKYICVEQDHKYTLLMGDDGNKQPCIGPGAWLVIADESHVSDLKPGNIMGMTREDFLIQISQTKYSTIGCFVRKSGEDNLYGLTAGHFFSNVPLRDQEQHVFYGKQHVVSGFRIETPISYMENVKTDISEVTDVIHISKDYFSVYRSPSQGQDMYDVALFGPFTDQVMKSHVININCHKLKVGHHDNIKQNMKVKKIGASTGVTKGMVVGKNRKDGVFVVAPYKIDEEDSERVCPSTDGKFADTGDSGSIVILDEEDQSYTALGIVSAGCEHVVYDADDKLISCENAVACAYLDSSLDALEKAMETNVKTTVQLALYYYHLKPHLVLFTDKKI